MKVLSLLSCLVVQLLPGIEGHGKITPPLPHKHLRLSHTTAAAARFTSSSADSLKQLKQGQEEQRVLAPVEDTVFIDTYFHIVTEDNSKGKGSVTDDVVNEQIEVLNQAFRSTGFQFHLKGITRTAKTSLFFVASFENDLDRQRYAVGSELRQSSTDPASKKTLNIYSLYMRPKGIGLGTYPWDFEGAGDGVFVDTCSLPYASGCAPYNSGRILVYSTGQWLGLYNVAHGGCDDEYGDFVSDTAPLVSYVYSCDSDTVDKVSCPNAPKAQIDNWMSYSSVVCSNPPSFTQGQIKRMHQQWSKYRGQDLSGGAPETTPEPTPQPMLQPTLKPTLLPTVKETEESTPEATANPTAKPTLEMETTSEPAAQLTSKPTSKQIQGPTAEPTSKPTLELTSEPTSKPTPEPTKETTSVSTTGSAPLLSDSRLADQRLVYTFAIEMIEPQCNLDHQKVGQVLKETIRIPFSLFDQKEKATCIQNLADTPCLNNGIISWRGWGGACGSPSTAVVIDVEDKLKDLIEELKRENKLAFDMEVDELEGRQREELVLLKGRKGSMSRKKFRREKSSLKLKHKLEEEQLALRYLILNESEGDAFEEDDTPKDDTPDVYLAHLALSLSNKIWENNKECFVGSRPTVTMHAQALSSKDNSALTYAAECD